MKHWEKIVKNWRGIEAHRSDDLVHWTNNDPDAFTKVREKWAKLTDNDPEKETILEELLGIARENGMLDESYDDS